VVYSLAKFHASEREDMDVRMILPSDALEAEKANVLRGVISKAISKAVGSGRPFFWKSLMHIECHLGQVLVALTYAVPHLIGICSPRQKTGENVCMPLLERENHTGSRIT